MTMAVLALGGNLGDRERTIAAGIRDIADLPGVELTAVSTLIETAALKPEGIDTDAPAYLNGVVIVSTDREPRELLRDLNAIEREHGRVREERWGDRTLDIDIIDFGGQTLASDDLTLPHPRAHERAFVLAPWLQIDPDAVLTGHGRIDALLTDVALEHPTEPPL